MNSRHFANQQSAFTSSEEAAQRSQLYGNSRQYHQGRFTLNNQKANKDDKENFPPFEFKGHQGLGMAAGSQIAAACGRSMRVPLREITGMMTMPESSYDFNQHATSLACLLKCTTWTVEVEDVTDENNPIPIISLVSKKSLRLFSKTQRCTSSIATQMISLTHLRTSSMLMASSRCTAQTS